MTYHQLLGDFPLALSMQCEVGLGEEYVKSIFRRLGTQARMVKKKQRHSGEQILFYEFRGRVVVTWWRGAKNKKGTVGVMVGSRWGAGDVPPGDGVHSVGCQGVETRRRSKRRGAHSSKGREGDGAG